MISIISATAVFLSSILIVGCSNYGSNHPDLISAEELMAERPDSALYILQNIDTLALKSSPDKAFYSLLFVQAQDKNYIDTQDDAQIRIAVDFYKDSKDDYHKMLSYYYLARIYENSQEYSNAIINLFRAGDLAKKLNDYFYLGLIYRSCSNIYDKIYNNVESLDYARRSYDCFKRLNRIDYESWALWRLACAYHNSGDYHECLAILQRVADMARGNNDIMLYVEAIKSSILSHLVLLEYDDVLKLYEELSGMDSFEMSVDDYQNLGLAYVGVGDYENAGFCMDNVLRMDSTQQWLPYEIYKRMGDLGTSLLALENELSYQDSILHNVITQEVTKLASDYHNSELQFYETKLAHERGMTTLAISVLIIIVALLTAVFFQKNKAHRKEIESNMLVASNLRNLLEVKEMEVREMTASMISHSSETLVLQEKLDHTEKEGKEEIQRLQSTINNLFEQHFSTIDKLTSAYYGYQGTVNEKHKIYKDVMEIVSGLGSDHKTLKELEDFVNTYKGNIMSRFKETFPEMKEQDCILYLYSVVGFSSRAISIFLNEKIEVVYNRKSRLKQKINRSLSQEKEVFMQFL